MQVNCAHWKNQYPMTFDFMEPRKYDRSEFPISAELCQRVAFNVDSTSWVHITRVIVIPASIGFGRNYGFLEVDSLF